jgi:hypothetical protein
MNCGNCLVDSVQVVELVGGKCPKCGTLYHEAGGGFDPANALLLIADAPEAVRHIDLDRLREDTGENWPAMRDWLLGQQIGRHVRRRLMELAIVEAAVDGILAAGYAVAVDNGGDSYEVKPTQEKATIMAGLFATDDEKLIAIHPTGFSAGWVQMVYGNDGYDVLCDWTRSMHTPLAAAIGLSEKFEREL